LTSINRRLRRAILTALDRLPPQALLEDTRRRRGLWKRLGERLHPFELARELPTAALAFAALRETRIASLDFPLSAACPNVRISDTVMVDPPGAPVEAALRSGDASAAVALLAERPADLLRRIDHLARIARPDVLPEVVAAVQRAAEHGAPGHLLQLAAHVARPDSPHARETAAAIANAMRGALLARADKRRHFARAVIDRALEHVPVPTRRARPAAPTIWELATIHAAARANIVYVRSGAGELATYSTRDGESALRRLGRIHAGEHDGLRSKIPPAQAPTWVALVHGDVPLPSGSEGYIHDGDPGAIRRLDVASLIADLALADAMR
jgi:hypothetical protein